MTKCKLIKVTKAIPHSKYEFLCQHTDIEGPIQVILCTGDDELKATKKAEQLVDDDPNGDHNYCK